MKKRLSDKGARGFGYGAIDAETRAFIEPDFDKNRQVGETAVGGLATARNPGVAKGDK